MTIKAGPLAAIGVGALFVYSGIRGYSILKAAQNVIRGTAPQTSQQVARLSVPGNEASTSGTGGIQSLIHGSPAQIAQSYVGKLRYVFGGPPPPGTVDCSSFANKVLFEAGIQNPGGAAFNPNDHGPNTLSYLAWSGARTVGHTADVAQVDDLVVWQTHMGICIGGGKMVSARDPAEGVGIDSIAGDMPGELLFVRRLV